MAWYEADSFHINVGAVDSGLISDTFTNNSIRHTLEEVNGTPGFSYEYWYALIPVSVDWIRVVIDGYYNGNPGHIIEARIWNYTLGSWYHFTTIIDGAVDDSYMSPDLPAVDYVSGGQSKVQFYHVSPGNASHLLSLDQVVLEDRTSFHTTSSPTTIPATTLTTLVPTTSVPVDEDIIVSPIEINLSFYHVFNYNPPAPVNEGLNTSYIVDPIEIVLSVHGYNAYTGIVVSPINIVITPIFEGIDIGKVISTGAVNIVIVPAFTAYSVAYNKCNFVKWSKIGELDFTIDESNLAGERPLDWKGCIYHMAKLGDKVVAYGENGVSILKPSGVHYGMDTIHRIGLKNKGAFAGTDLQHFFVDNQGFLYQLDDKFTKLDYSEFLLSMGTIILSLDIEKNLLYICDGVSGYIYGIGSKSFGVGPVNITGFGVQSSNIYVVSFAEIATPIFNICTDIYDLGTRKPKTITAIEVGTDATEFLYTSIDYRKSYKDSFKQIGWFLVNPSGKAFPKCYGVEFRFRLKSTIYEYLEIDYLKIRGHIHGYSYLDTVQS